MSFVSTALLFKAVTLKVTIKVTAYDFGIKKLIMYLVFKYIFQAGVRTQEDISYVYKYPNTSKSSKFNTL
jgi:hypothetical protein